MLTKPLGPRESVQWLLGLSTVVGLERFLATEVAMTAVVAALETAVAAEVRFQGW